MREMKDSGIEWIGEVPAEWNLVQTKRFFSNTKRIVGTEIDKYDRLALTLNGVIKRSKDDSEGLQPEKFEGYQILRKNELVFKLIDLENVKTSRVGLSPYTGLVSPAYIVLTNDFEDNRFFYYWFMFMYYNEVFNHLGGEGVRSALNAKDVLSLPVPDVRFDEQRRIADYLDRKCSQIDAIIARQQEVIEKLKAYKLSKINEIVVEVEGITAHLGYVANMKNGLNFNVVPDGKTLKFLGVGDFKDHYVLDSEEMFSDILVNDEITSEYMLQSGDIIFVRSNGSRELVGRAVMVENVTFPLSYSGFCIRFRNLRTDILNSKYLLYFFRSPYFRKQLEKYSQGSNITNINQVLLSQISIIIPPFEVQLEAIRKVEKLLAAIDKLITGKQEIVSALERYKKSLIYEVVTGKKEV